MKIREIYYKVLRKFLKKTFPFWQMLGFHITPVHFYEPIPDTRKLKDNLWEKHSQLIRIDMIINIILTMDHLNQSMEKFFIV